MLPNVFGFVQTIFEMLWTYITGDTVLGSLSTAIDGISVQYPQMSGLIDCVGAACKTFLPIQAIYQCLLVKVPIALVSFVLACVYRGKSFIPTMGD